MAALIKYSIENYDSIIFSGIQFALPKDTIDLITSIANQVGAADYIKTPQFPKKDHPQPGRNHTNDGNWNKNNKGKNNRNKNSDITNDDWDAIRNFQATEIKRKEGVDGSIDTIRKSLNKITEKTYEKMSVQIYEEIDKIIANGDISTNDEDLKKIGEAVFVIASGNAFYSNIYAKLFKALMNKYSFMNDIFNFHFNKFNEIFTSIEYCSPNDNYDKFCENNKNNDKRRALSMFYVNLMKEGILTHDIMINIIKNVQSHFNEKIGQEGNKDIIDELSENIYILIINTHNDLVDEIEWDTIVNTVETVSKYKVKDLPSITTKSIFKHMDILDELN